MYHNILDAIDAEINKVEEVKDNGGVTPAVVEPNFDYYNDRSYWSNSMAKELSKNEKLFDEWYRSNIERPCEDKFAVGQYLHSYLERQLSGGNEIECNFIILPKLDMRTKVGKEEYARLTKGKDLDKHYVISESDARKVEHLIAQFLLSDVPKELGLVGGSFELEKPFVGDFRGVKIKGRIDCVTDDTVIDWKTTSSYSDWANKAKFYDYDQQAFWYLTLTGKKNFKFVVFDTVDFNRFMVCEAGEEFINSGRSKMVKSIHMIKDYLSEGVTSKCFTYKKL
jgi:hypothetical protein